MSQYTEMLEFFAENGIQLTSEQLKSLREAKSTQSSEYQAKVAAWEEEQKAKAKAEKDAAKEAKKQAAKDALEEKKKLAAEKKEHDAKVKQWEKENKALQNALGKKELEQKAEEIGDAVKAKKSDLASKLAAWKAARDEKAVQRHIGKMATESAIDFCIESGLSVEETVEFLEESGYLNEE